MALDRNQLKAKGFKYAKALQMLMKTVRVCDVRRNRPAPADGDTVFDDGSESFLLSTAMQELQSGPDPMDMLFQSAFGDKLMQSAADETGKMAADGFGGSGGGVAHAGG